MLSNIYLKINFDLEFQIAITWNAIKRYLHHAVDFAQSVL